MRRDSSNRYRKPLSFLNHLNLEARVHCFSLYGNEKVAQPSVFRWPAELDCPPADGV
jgi:hypothetical protein